MSIKDNIPELSEADIEAAMRECEGFIDITPEDFRTIYNIAYRKSAAHHKIKKPGLQGRPGESAGNRAEMGFWRKMITSVSEPAPRVSMVEILCSWLGAFLGIGAVGWLHYKLLTSLDLVMIIGSFGASAVLIYGAIRSPLAQPRNLIGGHLFSAIIGVTTWKLFSFEPWLAGALAVATAIAFMHLTRTLHPPGGATALIAVIGSSSIHDLGYFYALVPVLSGALIMLVVALLVNNSFSWRKYPEFWW